jgi:hypothetical protein
MHNWNRWPKWRTRLRLTELRARTPAGSRPSRSAVEPERGDVKWLKKSRSAYPTWLQQEMKSLIPPEVLETYGELVDTSINGSYWHLPPESERAIVATLKARGFLVKKAAKLGFY